MVPPPGLAPSSDAYKATASLSMLWGPKNGCGWQIRTTDLRLMRLTSYLCYTLHQILAVQAGLEPATKWLTVTYSTYWATGHHAYTIYSFFNMSTNFGARWWDRTTDQCVINTLLSRWANLTKLYYGESGEIRTPIMQFWRLPFCQLELLTHMIFGRGTGPTIPDLRFKRPLLHLKALPPN